MNNLFKELRKYIYIILVIIMIGLNSYNISQNTKHCNSNAKATIQLSNGVALLADTFTRFIKTYAKDKKELNNNYFELDRDITDFRMKTILMDLQILNNHLRTVGNRLDNAIIKKKIIDLHKKPSFKYLKSITVYVAGETIPNITNKITREAFTDRWCGSGVIVKIDKNYTYILTNKHVVTDDKLCSIFIGKDKKTRRKVIEIKIHESQDLALVKIKGAIKGKQAIKGLAFPEITEKVYTVGHSLCRPFIYGEGVFSGTVIEHDIYQLSVIGGQSGSGIFDKNGYLLGLIYSHNGARTDGEIAWDHTRVNSVKGIYIKHFLEENL